MQKAFEKIKERVCEFIHVRNKSGSAPCKNQRASCLQLIRVCDLTAIINQVAEEYKQDLTKVNQEYNQGWIPCSERLPEIAGYRVLATLENPFGQKKVDTIFTGYGLNPFWHCNNPETDLNIWKVIAWQPLPEPYKGE